MARSCTTKNVSLNPAASAGLSVSPAPPRASFQRNASTADMAGSCCLATHANRRGAALAAIAPLAISTRAAAAAAAFAARFAAA